MCGIAAVLSDARIVWQGRDSEACIRPSGPSLDVHVPSPNVVQSLIDALKPRGPDFQGQHIVSDEDSRLLLSA